MIYTCYEMIRDCRADRPEGWRYFVAVYIPVIRKLLAHYRDSDPPATLDRILSAVRRPDSALFQSLDPAPERWFVAQLRQTVLEHSTSPDPAVTIDLETLASAFEPLTLTEKQAVWLETMLYSAAETGVLLRMAPPTVDKIRAKGAGLVRGKIDTWSSSLLMENGRALGKLAAAAGGEECLAPKIFLDQLDGRTSWRGREELEQHANRCWHCIDHFCRLVEVVELLRGIQPLTETEAAAFNEKLGIPAAKRAVWKRWLT